MLGSPWRPYCALGSYIFWTPWQPFFGAYSVPCSVSMASFWHATLCFGIIFRRCLGVPPVVHASYRSSSGMAANFVIQYILLPVLPLPVVRPPPTLLLILRVPLSEHLSLILFPALLHMYCQVDCYLHQCSQLLMFHVGCHRWLRGLFGWHHDRIGDLIRLVRHHFYSCHKVCVIE